MKMCIPGSRFLSGRSLISDGENFFWSEKTPEDTLIFGDSRYSLSIERIFNMLGEKPPALIDSNVVKSYKALGVREEDIPIDAVQDYAVSIQKVKSAFSESKRVLSALEEGGYVETYKKSIQALDSVQRAKFNTQKFHSDFKLGKIKNTSVAKTFKTNKDGYLNSVEYSITNTTTGRMTVKRGPQILTAPKYYRNYIESSFRGGKVIQADFISLEPRVAIHIESKDSELDVYSFLMNKIFSEKVPRKLMKKIVLCSMYGASERTIREDIPTGYNAREIISKTRKILNFDSIVKEQKENLKKVGYIKNYFGRPVYPQDTRDAIIFNNYIQSTAVDVSLLGFKKVIEACSDLKVRPLFFIHDAVVLDIMESDITEFKNRVSSIEISNLGKFPIEISFLNDN